MNERTSTYKRDEVLIRIFIFLLSSLWVDAQAQTQSVDTIGAVKDLDEIVVMAEERIVSADKTMYYPTKEVKACTNNAIQLLSTLQIPELIVNPAGGSVSTTGRSKLSIRINGHKVSESDLLSVSSKDITRIDYISNPGKSYGDVDAVLDITVKRKESGYGIMANVLQSVNRGWGNYTGAFKYNVGCSEWSLDYSSNPMWKMDCYRDNAEHIRLPDGSFIDRNESGIKTPNRMVTHRMSLQYSYAVGNRMLLNLQGRLTRGNDKYVSKGYITAESEGEISSGLESEKLLSKNWQGDFDIYMHYKINKRHKVFVNIVPSLTDGTNYRTYEASGMKIVSNIGNRGYHLLVEGIWEGTVGKGTLSAGARSQNGWMKSCFLTARQVVREIDTDNQLFAEWRQNRDKLEYSVGLEATLYSVKKPLHYISAFLNPRFAIRYRPFSWGGLNISLNTTAVSPSINQISPVRQQVDQYLWSVGNPDLKPFQKYEQKIEFDFNHSVIFAKISITDRYCHNPVMGAKSYVNNEIVGSYFNSGFNNDFEVRGVVRLPLFIRQLTLSVDGGWHKTVSKGIDYRHSYSQPFVNVQLMYMARGYWIMARYNNSYNQLWGETISSVNQNLLNFGVGYTYRGATFSIGMVNPFGNVSIRTKDLGDKFSYDRKYQASGSRKLVWLGVTVNFHKGKKRSATKKKLDNTTIYESISNTKK